MTATGTFYRARVNTTVPGSRPLVDAELIARPYTDTPRDYNKTTRVFGAADYLAPELNAEVERWTCTPVVHGPADRTDAENAIMKSYGRARRALVRHLNVEVPRAVEQAIAELRSAGHVVRVNGSLTNHYVIASKFSVRAGCSMCPCSPGFVLDVRITVDGRPVDLWIRPRATA